MRPCLIPRNIRYGSRIKWSNPGKGVTLSLTHRCCIWWTGHLRIALDYGRQLYSLRAHYHWSSVNIWFRIESMKNQRCSGTVSFLPCNFIFLLNMEWESKNSAAFFFAYTPLFIRWIIRICEVIQFFRKWFSVFLRVFSISVRIIDSEVVVVRKRTTQLFINFFIVLLFCFCFFHSLCRIMEEVCPQFFFLRYFRRYFDEACNFSILNYYYCSIILWNFFSDFRMSGQILEMFFPLLQSFFLIIRFHFSSDGVFASADFI